MFARIVPGHIQIDREVELRAKVLELAAKHGIADVEQLHAAYAERMFADQLQNSLCVSDLPEVRTLISALSERVEFDFSVHLFLVNIPTGFAATFPRKYFDGESNGNQSVVIVSQHFFNDLAPPEQLFILGHEIAHIALEHYKVPSSQLLAASDLAFGGSRADIAAYSICCEISCDLVGLVAASMDQHAAVSAMAKLTTGLDARAIERMGLAQVSELFRVQYESLSSSALATRTSSHPLTPSRLEVLRRFCESGIVESLSAAHCADSRSRFRLSLQELVSRTLSDIYPDLDRNREWPFEKEASAMAWAVALSDGTIDVREHSVLQRLMPAQHYGAFKQYTDSEVGRGGAVQATDVLVNQAIHTATEKGIRKPDAVRVLRKAALAARADEKVVAEELNTMFRFGDSFGLDKHDVITIVRSRWEEQNF